MAKMTSNTKQIRGLWVVEYIVEKEDCLWNIVKKAGFPAKSWKKHYDAPYNANFKKKLSKEKRKPDLIYKGEKFWLPKYKKEDCQRSVKYIITLEKKIGENLKTQKRLWEHIVKMEKGMDKDSARYAPKVKEIKKNIEEQEKRLDQCYSIAEGEDDPYAVGFTAYLCETGRVKQELKKAKKDLNEAAKAEKSDIEARKKVIKKIQIKLKAYDQELVKTAKLIGKSKTEAQMMCKKY